MRLRRDHPDWGYGKLFYKALMISIFRRYSWCGAGKDEDDGKSSISNSRASSRFQYQGSQSGINHNSVSFQMDSSPPRQQTRENEIDKLLEAEDEDETAMGSSKFTGDEESATGVEMADISGVTDPETLERRQDDRVKMDEEEGRSGSEITDTVDGGRSEESKEAETEPETDKS